MLSVIKEMQVCIQQGTKSSGKKDTFCMNSQENRLYLNLNSEFSSYVSFFMKLVILFNNFLVEHIHLFGEGIQL